MLPKQGAVWDISCVSSGVSPTEAGIHSQLLYYATNRPHKLYNIHLHLSFMRVLLHIDLWDTTASPVLLRTRVRIWCQQQWPMQGCRHFQSYRCRFTSKKHRVPPHPENPSEWPSDTMKKDPAAPGCLLISYTPFTQPNPSPHSTCTNCQDRFGATDHSLVSRLSGWWYAR